MKRKLLGIGIIVMLIFVLAACNTDFNLEQYRADAKTTIETYAQEKGQTNYLADAWATIQSIVADGKAAVESAESKTNIDIAVTAAKTDIDEVSREEMALIEQAKQSYVDTFLKVEYPDATIADLTFRNLGVYGESVVGVINDKYHLFFMEYVINLVIDGLDFSYSNGYPIRVWREGNFYDLSGAYWGGLLTRENLEAIYNIYRNIG